jgi:hypothetical protein
MLRGAFIYPCFESSSNNLRSKQKRNRKDKYEKKSVATGPRAGLCLATAAQVQELWNAIVLKALERFSQSHVST